MDFFKTDWHPLDHHTGIQQPQANIELDGVDLNSTEDPVSGGEDSVGSDEDDKGSGEESDSEQEEAEDEEEKGDDSEDSEAIRNWPPYVSTYVSHKISTTEKIKSFGRNFW